MSNRPNKYLYRLTTPFGNFRYYEGSSNDRVEWPKSLIKGTWFYRTFLPWIYLTVHRKKLYHVNDTWQQCFYFPAKKLI